MLSGHNRMEQQTLDFNRPVLSVRRCGPTAGEAGSKAGTEVAEKNNYPSIPFYKADLKSGPIRNPGTVPFAWEKIPGKPKHERKSLYQNSELPPIAPRLPPGKRRDANEKLAPVRSQDCLRTDLPQAKNLKSPHRSFNVNQTNVKTGNFQEGCTEPEDSSSEEDDDAFVDAQDTLSVTRSESFFENCSLSGLSGMDGSDENLGGTVSADPEAIDFMMGRFLPAAKAMTSETTPHSSKKMYVVREQPKQATVTVKVVKHVSTPDYKPNLLRHYIQNDIEEDSEEDGEEDDQRNTSSKGCGLLPRFCLLNPVPGLRNLPQTKPKSVRRVHAKGFRTAHGTKCITVKNSAADRRTSDIQVDRSCPSIESASTENESFQCTIRNENQFAGTYIESKQAKNFASGPKAFKTFQDFLLDQNGEHDSQPEIPLAEKTLYIDSGNGTETPSNLEAIKDITIVTENYDQFHDKEDSSVVAPSRDSLAQEMTHLCITDVNKALKDEMMGPLDSVETLAGVCHYDSTAVADNYSVKDEVCGEGQTVSEDSKESEHKDNKNQQLHLVASNRILIGRACPQLPLPPPLPNSPSDSWLCRALPSMSSKNLSSRLYQGSPMHIYSKQKAPKQNSLDPKWETMVKTSKPQRGHHRYSEEMLDPIPEA